MRIPSIHQAPWPRFLTSIGVGVLLSVVPGAWTDTWALNTEVTRATLRGLAGVEVDVAPVSTALEEASITKQILQAEVEQQLHQAGVPVFVLTREEASSRMDVAFFTVSVSTLNHELGVYAYSVDLALYQPAMLLRDATPLSLPTWTTGSLGLIGESRLNVIAKTVSTSVEQFIQAYNAVNPPAKPAVSSTTIASATRIRQVQKRLRSAGFSPGSADGQLGPQTQQALRLYQRAKKLKVTGELDKKTLDALGIK